MSTSPFTKRIILRCPSCKREEQATHDWSYPDEATVVEFTCGTCFREGYAVSLRFLNAEGIQLSQ